MIEKIKKNSTVQFFVKTTLFYFVEFFTGLAIQLALGIIYTSLGVSFVAVQLNIDITTLISGQESLLFSIIMGVAVGITMVILITRFLSEQFKQIKPVSVLKPVELNTDAG